MPTPSELKRRARDFAVQVNDLLNGTVVDGPRLTVVTNDHGDRAWIGYGIKRKDVVPSAAMPITISAAPPRAFLHVYHVLTLEPRTRYLTTARSDVGVYMDQDMTECLCRYDYEREKPDGYPEAHLHVYGDSDAVGRCGTEKRLGDLHFPVGGRRFRPALEDMIGFLIGEGLAQGKAHWDEIVEVHRDRFYKIQLRAAIRRDPQTALARHLHLATPRYGRRERVSASFGSATVAGVSSTLRRRRRLREVAWTRPPSARASTGRLAGRRSVTLRRPA